MTYSIKGGGLFKNGESMEFIEPDYKTAFFHLARRVSTIHGMRENRSARGADKLLEECMEIIRRVEWAPNVLIQGGEE